MPHAFTKDAIPTQLSALIVLYQTELAIWQPLAEVEIGQVFTSEPQQVARGNVYALEGAILLFKKIHENPRCIQGEITRLYDLLWQWKGEHTEEPYQLARIDGLEMIIEDLQRLESYD